MTDNAAESEAKPKEKSKSRSRRKWYVTIAVLICLIPIGIYILNWGSGAAEGIYLINGGQNCVKIERGWLGGLKVTDGHGFDMPYGESKRTMKAWYRFGKLHLEQKEKFHIDFGPQIGKIKTMQHVALVASEDIPGDWNLTESQRRMTGLQGKMFALSDVFEFSIDGIGKAFDILFGEAGDMLHHEYPAAADHLPSFLHRIDDADLLAYFETRRLDNDETMCLNLMRSLGQRHPGDPFLMLHQVEVEARLGDMDKALETWKEWKRLHGPSADPLLKMVSVRAWNNMLHFQWLQNHDTAYYDEIFRTAEEIGVKGRYSWDVFENWLLERSEQPSLQLMYMPIVMTQQHHDIGMRMTVPNFLVIQTITKCAVVNANLAMLEGDFEKSRRLLTGAHLLAMDYNAYPDTIITSLIGMACRSITSEGFREYLINGCKTEEDVLEACRLFDTFDTMPERADEQSNLIGEFTPLQVLMDYTPAIFMPNIEEVTTRFNVAEAKTALLRQGAWARLYLFRQGDWPVDINAMHTDIGAPKVADPFDTSSTLKMTTSGTQLVVYSIGPDKKDDLMKITYDPSNGSKSAGDIFFSLPKRTTSPYPDGGVHADSAEELLEMFPEGLPVDNFSNYAYSSGPSTNGLYSGRFGIMDATTTRPLTVFSAGPDARVEDVELTTPPDFWKKPGGIYQPVLVHQYLLDGKGESETSDAIGATLMPQYDPTNGTLSDGDIFIEIPRRSK
jgi:hypothetical protein